MTASQRKPSYTVSGASALGLVRKARQSGVDLGPTLAELGLVEARLAEPESRVEVAANDLLWTRAAQLSGDPDFGLHAAEQLDLDAFHMVGHLALGSRNLGEALERVVAFSRLLHDAGRTELERTADGMRFFPGCRGLPAPPPRHVAEFITASVVALGRMVTGRAWAPREVHLEHAAPAAVREHRRILGVAPTFNAPETMLVLDADTLALPVVNRSSNALGRYLEGYAQRLLTELNADQPEEGLRAQVLRILVGGMQEGAVGMAEAAARLGITARTLQRRLAEENTGFQELVEQARRARAERYLADGVLPLAEVAYLLGFADPSNFHRAFRRWTGVTPGEFRERAGGGIR